ncbi:MAG: hypothetical protein H7195_05055, partial [Chryseobacterium sp.]|nr:hypothetical protein [Chryseobacterium sp.]
MFLQKNKQTFKLRQSNCFYNESLILKAFISYIAFISLFYFSFLACNTENRKANSVGFENEMEGMDITQINDFIIDSGRVGIIRDTDSKENIIQKFGNEHIQLDSFFLEGMYQEMILLIDSGKNEELEIHFNEDNKVAVIGIKQNKSPYHYKNGIKVGTSLFDLTQLNKKPIEFYGFGWDYSGRIAALNNGKLKT